MARHLAHTPEHGRHYARRPERGERLERVLTCLVIVALVLACIPTHALRAFAEETGIEMPVIYDAPAPVEEEPVAEEPVADPDPEVEEEEEPVVEPAENPAEEPAVEVAEQPASEGVTLTAQSAEPILVAQSDESPVLVSVTLIGDDYDTNNPLKDSSGNVIDLATASSAVTEDAHRIRVLVRDEDFDASAASSYVALYTSDGTNPESIPFMRVGTSNEYEAILDGDAYTEPSQSLPEGSFGVLIVAKDTSGHALKSGENDYVLVCAELSNPSAPFDNTNPPKANGKFTVNHPPQVTVTIADPAAPVNIYNGVAFYTGNVTVNIKITDATLDKGTSVFGRALDGFPSSAGTELVAGVTMTARSAYAIGDSQFTTTLVFNSANYLYDLSNLVVAKDASGNETTVSSIAAGSTSGITHLVVDTTAPSVTAATLGKEPYDLGTGVNGTAIDANGNRIWIVPGAGNGLTLRIKEQFGIQSIVMSDPTGHYSVSSSLDSQLATWNATIADGAHSNTHDITVIDVLDDGYELADDTTFTITDFVGNSYTWSLAANGTSQVVGGTATSTTNPNVQAGTTAPFTNLLNPTLLVPDDEAPVLTVTGPEDTENPSNRVFPAGQALSLTLTESNLFYLLAKSSWNSADDPFGLTADGFAGLDPTRIVLTYTYTPADGGAAQTKTVTVSDLTRQGAGSYTWTTTLSDEGTYAVSAATFKDVADHESAAPSITDFVIDATAPVIEVSYDHAPSGWLSSTIACYDTPITATVKVAEPHFDASRMVVNAYGGIVGSWTTDSDGKHVLTVCFPEGRHDLLVGGSDIAGNQVNPVYEDDDFIVDASDPLVAGYYARGMATGGEYPNHPKIEMPEPAYVYEGVYYYSHGITLPVEVQDHNFEEASTTVYVSKNGVEAAQSVSWVVENSAPSLGDPTRWCIRPELSFEEDGSYVTPRVVSVDIVGHTGDNASLSRMNFVVDTQAPAVTASVDRVPSVRDTSDGDPRNFYNQQTTMTLVVADEHLLRSVELADPDGIYSVTSSEAAAEGKPQVTLTVKLKDPTTTSDGAFDRAITLSATDLAGNAIVWSISPTGQVTVDSTTAQAANAALTAPDGSSEHPLALVQDSVAPVVTLSGPANGYHNSGQRVTLTVTEMGMDWIRLLDPDRTILTIAERAPQAGASTTTTELSVSDLTGTRPTYSWSELFDSDGHYILTAQLTDYAGNASATATVGEFTIDTTAPYIDVEFDNEDVRNDKYYKAPRTATITVEEHNFDPSLIKIETTGDVSGWSTSGDTHTCTVYFGEGSAHTLTVSGTDLAGNAGDEFTEDEFVVDLTPPEVTIVGTAQRLGYYGADASEAAAAYHDTLEDRSAYNGVVVPTITYSDNEELSSDDLDFTLTGARLGEDVDYDATTSAEGTEMTTTLRDLGYVGPGVGDGSNWRVFFVDDYSPAADDVYTLKATMCDQAGNEAEAELVFSVNRYGSTYLVEVAGLDGEEEVAYQTTGMLAAAPTIVVREINVAGVGDAGAHYVQKEYANVTTLLAQSDAGAGFGLTEVAQGDAPGWSEYVYTIRAANFGEGSDSDNNDRGQGLYRVNVMSNDRASNANSTASYWSVDEAREQASATAATTEFVLDELAPVIDDVDIPSAFSAGESAEASFHVTDDISSGDRVQVFVDGRELDASEVHGPASGVGTFTFAIPARAFDWTRSVRIVVTDYAGRTVEAGNGGWLWQSSFVLEGLAGAGVVAALVAGIVTLRRRREAQEPELPW